MNDLISIIVPVYNVEKYLNRCIESIVSQTYKKLEIILVDDGSSDKCPQICDEWAKKDSRIKVIHKENHGVSSARNTGLINSKGDYIGFVDPDDYIEHNMYEELLYSLKESNMKISMCGYSKIKDNEILSTYICDDKIISSEKLLNDIFNEIFMGVVWNKLFVRTLFINNEKQILFNENIHYCEDILILVNILNSKDNIAIIKKPLYNYIVVNTSITHSIISEKKLTIINAIDLIVNLGNKKFPSLVRKIKSWSCRLKISLLIDLKQSSFKKRNEYIPKLKKYIKENFKYCNTKVKLRAIMALYFPSIYILLKKLKRVNYK